VTTLLRPVRRHRQPRLALERPRTMRLIRKPDRLADPLVVEVGPGEQALHPLDPSQQDIPAQRGLFPFV